MGIRERAYKTVWWFEVVVVTLIMSLCLLDHQSPFLPPFPLHFNHIALRGRSGWWWGSSSSLNNLTILGNWVGSSILSPRFCFLIQRTLEMERDWQDIISSFLFHNLRNWEIKKMMAFYNVMQLNRWWIPDSYLSMFLLPHFVSKIFYIFYF